MYLRIDPLLPVLLGLVGLVLLHGSLRGSRPRTWIVAILLIAAGVDGNPGKARHQDSIRRQAGDGAASERSGEGFADHLDYHDLLLASVTEIEGRTLSVGFLGQIVVLQPRPFTPRRS